MNQNYKEYLYFNGEDENPFKDKKSQSKRLDVFWHYEKLHNNSKSFEENLPPIKEYIKNIMLHSLDEFKSDLPNYNAYLNNSSKSQ